MTNVYVIKDKFSRIAYGEEIKVEVATCASDVDALFIGNGKVLEEFVDGWNHVAHNIIGLSEGYSDTKNSRWEFDGWVTDNAWTFIRETRSKWVFTCSEGRRVFYSPRRLRQFMNIEGGFKDFSNMKIGEVKEYDLFIDGTAVVGGNYVVRIA